MRKSGSLLAVLALSLGGVAIVSPAAAEAASCRQALGISVSPNPMAGNGIATATVRLRCHLGSHGLRVAVKSSWPGYDVPKSVWIPAHSNSARFTVRDGCPTRMETHSIGVQAGRLHASTTLKAWPCSVLSGFTISPGNVFGGQSATATVTLSSPAPWNGYAVDISGGYGEVDAPSLVTVPAGKTSTSFQVHVDPAYQHQDFNVTLQASAVAGSKVFTAPLTVTTLTPVVSYLSNEPGTRWYFRSGHAGNIQLVLTAPAPKGGTSVTLSTSGTGLTVPASVTVPAGNTTVEVPVTANPVTQETSLVVYATAYGVTMNHVFWVRPPGNLDSIGGPGQIVSGTSVQSTINLSYAQNTDTVVQLSSSDPLVSVPATVIVPAGQTSAPFTVTAGSVPQIEIVTITATLGGETVTGRYAVGPNKVVVLSVQAPPAPFTVGTTLQGVVRLWAPAPAGGATVTLTSSDPAFTVPATVQVKEGVKAAAFTGTLVQSLPRGTTITITASWNGTSASRTITVP